MPIENRELAAGTRLVARYKKQDRTCEVVETADGLRYRLDDGTEHRSPSSAGKAAMDGVACNGWRFWSIAGEETGKPKAENASKIAKPGEKASGKKKSGAKKPKSKAVRAASKSDSYSCGACGAEFPTMKAATKHALTHTSA